MITRDKLIRAVVRLKAVTELILVTEDADEFLACIASIVMLSNKIKKLYVEESTTAKVEMEETNND